MLLYFKHHLSLLIAGRSGPARFSLTKMSMWPSPSRPGERPWCHGLLAQHAADDVLSCTRTLLGLYPKPHRLRLLSTPIPKMKVIRSLKAKFTSRGGTSTVVGDVPDSPSKPSITDVLPTEIMEQIIEQVRTRVLSVFFDTMIPTLSRAGACTHTRQICSIRRPPASLQDFQCSHRTHCLQLCDDRPEGSL